jgi:hypothetical protein
MRFKNAETLEFRIEIKIRFSSSFNPSARPGLVDSQL